jgi:hypothetical protein
MTDYVHCVTIYQRNWYISYEDITQFKAYHYGLTLNPEGIHAFTYYIADSKYNNDNIECDMVDVFVDKLIGQLINNDNWITIICYKPNDVFVDIGGVKPVIDMIYNELKNKRQIH